MANIFVAFYNGIVDEENSNAIPIFYESFIEGLDKAGNNVYIVTHPYFGMDFGEISEELKHQIQGFKPDICFLFNNSFYDISDVVDCPIVIYEVDSPVYFSNKDNLRKNPERYIYFVCQSGSIDTICHLYGVPRKKIFHVPLFSEIHAEDMEQTTNISFIGSKMGANPQSLPNIFCGTNPSKEERKMYENCVKEIRDNPQITTTELICKLHVMSEKVALQLVVPEILMYISNEKRIHVLSAIVDFGLELYGTENWAKDYYYDYRLNLAYNSKRVYSLAHNQKIYNSSKIGISISHAQATSGFPWRTMDIMASNACLVTDYHTDFDEIFRGLKLPVYTSEYEAREICQRLLRDEYQRKEIVAQCQEIIENRYRFKHLLRRMEEYSNVIMHTD